MVLNKVKQNISSINEKNIKFQKRNKNKQNKMKILGPKNTVSEIKKFTDWTYLEMKE